MLLLIAISKNTVQTVAAAYDRFFIRIIAGTQGCCHLSEDPPFLQMASEMQRALEMEL